MWPGVEDFTSEAKIKTEHVTIKSFVIFVDTFWLSIMYTVYTGFFYAAAALLRSE